MVERILEQVQFIKQVFAPAAYMFTDILSGENYVTVSSLQHMLAHLEGEVRAGCQTHRRPEVRHLGADGRQKWPRCHPEDDVQSNLAWPKIQMRSHKATRAKCYKNWTGSRDGGSSNTRKSSPTQVREVEEESVLAPHLRRKGFIGQPSWEKSSTAAMLTADQKGEAQMSMYLQEMSIDGLTNLVES